MRPECIELVLSLTQATFGRNNKNNEKSFKIVSFFDVSG